MTIYTKTITAALALMLGAAPLVGTVSADAITSDGTVTFANETGALSIYSANDIEFGTIDLSSTSDFAPVATNQGAGKLVLNQTSANPGGTYGITVQQTGAWKDSGQTQKAAAADLPINYDGTSITSAQNFVSGATKPARGSHDKPFNYNAKNFTLDLTGSSDLLNAVNQSLTSEVTWTLTEVF